MILIIKSDTPNTFVFKEKELKEMFDFCFEQITNNLENRRPKSLVYLFDKFDPILSIEEKEKIINNCISKQLKNLEVEIEK